jgi:PII-like signaling protein
MALGYSIRGVERDIGAVPFGGGYPAGQPDLAGPKGGQNASGAECGMTHQKFEGERTLMRVHIGESDKWHGKPLQDAIVQLLRKEGFSGVTVLRGVGGYGGTSAYHTDKLLRLSQDLPIVLEVVETQERIEQILPRLDEMVDGGLITLEKVRVILYRGAKR